MQQKYFEIINQTGTTCFMTPSMNHFCYPPPRQSIDSKISWVVGSDGVNGELHFDPVSKGVSYFTMTNMTRTSGDSAIVTIADKEYSRYSREQIEYKITDKFEISFEITKYDTFVTNCFDYEGTGLNVIQYLGIENLDGVDYFLTWHTEAYSEHGITCKYPEIIKHGIRHDFKDL